MSTRKGRKIAIAAGGLVALILAALAWASWDELRDWYVLRQDFESLGKNAQGYREYRHLRTGIVFVRVPGGKFLMGSPDDEKEREADELQHEVTVSSFLIAKFEVSQKEWRVVLSSNPSRFKGDDLPVERVSWYECQEFCRNAGLRLPTEAWWEYACRAGTSGPHAGTGDLEDMGWLKANSRRRTHPVGQKQPNRFGLHDMHGNVWEFCEDVYDAGFYSKPAASGPNPVATSGSGGRVGRGGSWFYLARGCRSADRFRIDPNYRAEDIGFRPCYPLR